MATFQVSPPEAFDFSKPDRLAKMDKMIWTFRQASGLEMKGQEIQVNMLIYTMGNKADDILSSFGLSKDDQKSIK